MYKYSVKIRKVSGRLNESVLPSKSLVIKSKTKRSDEQVLSEASKFFKKKYGLVIESADISSNFFYPKGDTVFNFFFPRGVSVFIEILNSSGDKITTNIEATDPRTGKPIKFKDVKFEKLKSGSDKPDWFNSLDGMWDVAGNYWHEFTSYLEGIIDCSGGRYLTDDDYEQGEEEVMTTLVPIIDNLINRAIRQNGKAQLLVKNPYFS